MQQRELKESTNHLLAQFEGLQTSPDQVDAPWRRLRGRRLERLISECLQLNDLQPRTSFRPKGEEIDGSFIYGRRPYLLEAKWTDHPIPASDLYAFRGKVDGKLVGTVGVFISVSGYASNAVDALIAGKVLNIILFDKHDLSYCFGNTEGFCRAMEAKLRAAAEVGTPFLPLQALAILATRRQRERLGSSVQSAKSGRIAVVVEGTAEAARTAKVLQSIAKPPHAIQVIPALSPTNQVRLSHLLVSATEDVRVVALVESTRLAQFRSQLVQLGLGGNHRVTIGPEDSLGREVARLLRGRAL